MLQRVGLRLSIRLLLWGADRQTFDVEILSTCGTGGERPHNSDSWTLLNTDACDSSRSNTLGVKQRRLRRTEASLPAFRVSAVGFRNLGYGFPGQARRDAASRQVKEGQSVFQIFPLHWRRALALHKQHQSSVISGTEVDSWEPTEISTLSLRRSVLCLSLLLMILTLTCDAFKGRTSNGDAWCVMAAKV